MITVPRGATDRVYKTIAEMKLSLRIQLGDTITTQSYSNTYENGTVPEGGASYIIATLEQVRTALGDNTWTPDEVINHSLLSGTNYVAMRHSIDDGGDTTPPPIDPPEGIDLAADYPWTGQHSFTKAPRSSGYILSETEDSLVNPSGNNLAKGSGTEGDTTILGNAYSSTYLEAQGGAVLIKPSGDHDGYFIFHDNRKPKISDIDTLQNQLDLKSNINHTHVFDQTLPVFENLPDVDDYEPDDIIVVREQGYVQGNDVWALGTVYVASSGTGIPIPQITQQPTSSSITEGETLSMSARATGHDTVQWQKDQVNIPGATSSDYNKPLAVVSDSGVYRAAYTNTSGTVYTSSAIASVNEEIITTTEYNGVLTIGHSGSQWNWGFNRSDPNNLQWGDLDPMIWYTAGGTEWDFKHFRCNDAYPVMSMFDLSGTHLTTATLYFGEGTQYAHTSQWVGYAPEYIEWTCPREDGILMREHMISIGAGNTVSLRIVFNLDESNQNASNVNILSK